MSTLCPRLAIMASNAVVSGPTSKHVAENVERLRKLRRLHQKDVSALLADIGRPMLPTVISKIERGERRIDVDDLVALALAFNVSPLTLLLPPASSEEAVELTENVAVTSATAWAWGAGFKTAMDWTPGEGVNLASPGADPAIPLEAQDRKQEFVRRQTEYVAAALPAERRASYHYHPAVRLAQQLKDLVTDLVSPEPGVDPAGMAARGRMARRRHENLGRDLDEIIEQLPPVHPGVPLWDGNEKSTAEDGGASDKQ